MISINKVSLLKNKYIYLVLASLFILLLTVFLYPKEEDELTTNKLTATVISSSNDTLTVRDLSSLIYTFNVNDNNYKVGDSLIIEYTGMLNKNKEYQNTTLLNIIPVSEDEATKAERPSENLFSQFNTLASNKLKNMTLDEKIGQLLLVKYQSNSQNDAIKKYKVGGFIFFEDDFKDKTKKEVQDMLKNIQSQASIPLLTAVDEEGGSVVRVSSNPKLREQKFKSPRELYLDGGIPLIESDTKEKSALLEELGINVNLAPVVDISTNSSDYMYDRTLGEGQDATSNYAKAVIEASKGYKVSYVLKHFPGYGNNEDTHTSSVTDDRPLSTLEENDFKPFESAIESKAEAILVNHNIVKSIDTTSPASLSASVHNLLRNDLKFTGIIMTDDLSMKATSDIPNVVEKAILAGNDIVIVADYESAFNQIKDAVENNRISAELIDEIAHKIITWKYAKGLLYDKQK